MLCFGTETNHTLTHIPPSSATKSRIHYTTLVQCSFVLDTKTSSIEGKSINIECEWKLIDITLTKRRIHEKEEK